MQTLNLRTGQNNLGYFHNLHWIKNGVRLVQDVYWFRLEQDVCSDTMSLPDGSITEEPETSGGWVEHSTPQVTTSNSQDKEIDLVTNPSEAEEEPAGHIKRVTFCYTVDVYYPRPDHYPPPGNHIFMFISIFLWSCYFWIYLEWNSIINSKSYT